MKRLFGRIFLTVAMTLAVAAAHVADTPPPNWKLKLELLELKLPMPILS